METLARAANRGSISTGGYEIDNSLKFERDNAERMSRVITSTTNRRTWTWSGWVKRTNLIDTDNFGHILWKFGVDGSDGVGAIRFMNDDTVRLELGSDLVSVFYRIQTTRKFRDTSAWYHLVLAVDTTQATDTNRVKFYVNGVQETDFSSSTYPPQNFDTQNNYTQSSSSVWVYGGYTFPTTYGQANFYLAETNHIDGSQLAPTDFGEVDADTGIWKPIEYTGSYGTNGWYLNFSNSSALGEDFSGNNLDWTTFNNITSADQATDTPTNNFAILNPFFKYPPSQEITEGNTEVTRTSGAGLNKTFLVTIPVNNGKWYAEFTPVSSNSNYVVGIMPDTTAATVTLDSNHLGNGSYPESIGYYSATGGCLAAGNAANGAYGDTYTAGNIIGIALDMDNGYVYFSKNSTWQNSGDPTSGSSGTGGIALTNSTAAHLLGFTYDSNGNMHCNFGGYTVATISSAASDANGYGTFEYAPPTGYYALCSKNLAEFG